MTEKSTLKLLMVDDETFILSLSVRLLNKLGYEDVDTANNGVEALEKLDNSDPPYDVIICDLNMPEMNGVEFIYHAQQREFSGGLILLSGEDKRILETAKNLALEKNLNVLGVISKPLSPIALEELLEAYKPTISGKSDIDSDQTISEEELIDGLQGTGSELVLLYQPIAHIRSGEISGVETLVGWQHASRGLLESQTFIPLAEQHGLMVELTRKVYGKAVQQSAEWLSNGIYLQNSICVSAGLFPNPDLLEFILTSPQQLGVDPKYLILQLPESPAQSDSKNISEVLIQLRFKKLGVSIDSFSMGDAVMEQIKGHPFTQLKVNWETISTAGHDDDFEADIGKKIRFLKSMDMEIVAKGIQTKNDWYYAEKLGFDCIQGSFCSKPLFSEGLLEFVERWSPPPHRQ